MTSIRIQVLDAIATQIDSLSGWTGRRMTGLVPQTQIDKFALVTYTGERDVESQGSGWSHKEMFIEVTIFVLPENAPGGDELQYLDDCLVELQQGLQSDTNDRLGIAAVRYLIQRGHRIEQIEETSQVAITWELNCQYFHNYTDPEVGPT